MSQDRGKDSVDSLTTARQGHNTKMFDSPFKVDPTVDSKRDDPVWHFVVRGRYLDGSTAAGRKSGRRCLCRLCGRSICGGAKAAKEHFSKSEKFRREAATPAVWNAIWSKDMTKCPKEFASAIETLQSHLPGHPSLQWPPLRFLEDAVPPLVPPTAPSGAVASPNSGAPAIRVTVPRPATTVATRPAAPPSAPLAGTRGARDVGVGRSTPANEPPPLRDGVGSAAFDEESTHAFIESRSGMPFNSTKLESFKRMFTIIIPPGVPGAPAPRLPSYHMLRTTLLDELDGEVQKCVRPVLDTSRETGCTIMTDGWTNIRGQTLCNYLIGTEIGVVYVSTDVMRGKKDAGALANAWLKRVKSMDVQLSDITAFVTDSAGVNVAAMEVFQKDESVKHIFWIPCVAHIMDLILEDIGGIDWVAFRISQARLVTRFFKRHGHAREVLEAHSTKTLLLPAETRFGTNIIMMEERLVALRAALTDVVADDRWRETVWSTSKIRKDAAEVTACISSPPWWEDLRALCKMLEPIMGMLKLVDSDTRQISKILRRYEEIIASCLSACRDIDREQQDAIVEVFHRRRTMFKTPAHTAAMLLDPEFRDATLCDDAEVQQALVEALVQFGYPEDSPQHREVQREVAKLRTREPPFDELTMRRAADIFDHPASFWSSKKAKFPHTAVFAGRILRIWATASPCVRAWSRWSFIHSKSHNRLEVPRAEKLVRCHWNLRLLDRPSLCDDGVGERPVVFGKWVHYWQAVEDEAAVDQQLVRGTGVLAKVTEEELSLARERMRVISHMGAERRVAESERRRRRAGGRGRGGRGRAGVGGRTRGDAGSAPRTRRQRTDGGIRRARMRWDEGDFLFDSTSSDDDDFFASGTHASTGDDRGDADDRGDDRGDGDDRGPGSRAMSGGMMSSISYSKGSDGGG
ncbi:hypothetical protein CBR_g46257 [Chara braunii]|uniref:DUF659 domain-containing protein n=1 Tax=Chara braunii TaxID=69332 RepID=A0A388K3S2_CHABU|nr:hypothetical protein CBR_g46257 [Chara braunii]|eukprot:GBG64714.1 hypothetical protein CBR_g46257 [Chara braunii]